MSQVNKYSKHWLSDPTSVYTVNSLGIITIRLELVCSGGLSQCKYNKNNKFLIIEISFLIRLTD